MAKNFIMKLKLSNYINSRVVDIRNDDGEMEKGIFIPLDINGLFLSQRNQVISWAFVNEKMHYTPDGYSHYIKMKTTKDHLEKMNQLGYETPFLGGMKESTFNTSYQRNMEGKSNERVSNIIEE